MGEDVPELCQGGVCRCVEANLSNVTGNPTAGEAAGTQRLGREVPALELPAADGCQVRQKSPAGSRGKSQWRSVTQMSLKKLFEPYELLQMSPGEIMSSQGNYESYEQAVQILRWKIEESRDRNEIPRYKEQLRACLKKAVRGYYPWEAMCFELARDIASGDIKKKKFRELHDVIVYYRKRSFEKNPRLWKSVYEKIYRCTEKNRESF